MLGWTTAGLPRNATAKRIAYGSMFAKSSANLGVNQHRNITKKRTTMKMTMTTMSRLPFQRHLGVSRVKPNEHTNGNEMLPERMLNQRLRNFVSRSRLHRSNLAHYVQMISNMRGFSQQTTANKPITGAPCILLKPTYPKKTAER